MKELTNLNNQPQEIEQIPIQIRELFDTYLKSEYFKKQYKKNTQLSYAQGVRRFLKLSDSQNKFKTSQLPELINNFQMKPNYIHKIE